MTVLGIVSKFSIYDISNFRYIGLVLPSIPWHPRVFYADTERKLRHYQVFEIVKSISFGHPRVFMQMLNENFDVLMSKSYMIPYQLVFSLIGIVSYSIPTSISNTS